MGAGGYGSVATLIVSICKGWDVQSLQHRYRSMKTLDSAPPTQGLAPTQDTSTGGHWRARRRAQRTGNGTLRCDVSGGGCASVAHALGGLCVSASSPASNRLPFVERALSPVCSMNATSGIGASSRTVSCVCMCVRVGGVLEIRPAAPTHASTRVIGLIHAHGVTPSDARVSMRHPRCLPCIQQLT